jgi:hypothetical protein
VKRGGQKTVSVEELVSLVRRGCDESLDVEQLGGDHPAVGASTAQRLVVTKAATASDADGVKVSGH